MTAAGPRPALRDCWLRGFGAWRGAPGLLPLRAAFRYDEASET